MASTMRTVFAINGRGSGLGTAVRAVTQAVGGRHITPSPAQPLMSHWEEREECMPASMPCEHQWIEFDLPAPPQTARPLTSYSLSRTMFKRALTVGTGIGVGSQLRYYHNDIKIPDFEGYRKELCKDPTRLATESRDSRRVTMDVVKVGVGITAAIVAKACAKTAVQNLSPAASTLALGVIEIDLSQIPEGKNITIKWNNKPVFVKHRTDEEVARERAVNIQELRDPQTDEDRSVTGKWLVVMANCTHLGCVPISGQGNWPGGYYCPCHGSHYDGAGRIRKGPAPLNLEVPDHHIILDQHKLILGAKAPA